MKILIVEDEAITSLDLKYSLEELGYDVIGTVDTGHNAIKVSCEKTPDVVLMDIKLKGDMEGTQAAQEISKLNIPVIFLTANTDEDTFKKIEKTYGFISKPFDLNELDETIKKFE